MINGIKGQLLQYMGYTPKIGQNVFVADGVKIIGDVSIGDESNIWYNSVLRGDVANITIGKKTNVQDGTVIHTSRFHGGCSIGDRVTIGHLCMLHACHVHDDGFIGMSSSVLDNSVVESFGFVAAHALIPPGKVVRSYELWAGVPAKCIRKLTDHEIFLIKDTPDHYIMLANNHVYL
jgi:carbonic anhydrase/acetyltransferase-like protein (isoleucine patch superfamily)